MTNYIPVTETAKMMRLVLKETFPGVKFGVRSSSYSGGSSINVGWTDGPNEAQVKAAVDVFKGAYFDGQIDYKGYRKHLLDGVPTSFGGDFIFYSRENSDEAIARAVEVVKAQNMEGHDAAMITVEAFKTGKLWSMGLDHHWSAQGMISRRMAKVSHFSNPLPSATRARVQFAGDDGYGHGCVGDLVAPLVAAETPTSSVH